MKRLILILILVITLSCAEREVQLAETSLSEITKVLDVSPAYMFYHEETGDIEFNRKNLIGTTNWLINIDKRLTIEQILPHLTYLQEKRNKASMHKNEAAKNYLTCFNPETKSVSFIDFTNTQLSSIVKVEESMNLTETMYYCSVKFNSLDDIEIDTATSGHAVVETYSKLHSALNEINELSQKGKTTIILLFNEELSYQDYITIKSSFISLVSNNLKILPTEIIYN